MILNEIYLPVLIYHGVLNLSAGDVVAFKMYQNTGSAVNAEADGKTYFYGYKIIE